MDQAFATAAQHVPWNKGRLVGQKLPLRLKEIWAIRIRLQLAKRARSWRSSIWPLTASCEGVTSSAFASATSTKATGLLSERWSCNARRSDLFSSSLRSKRGTPWALGWLKHSYNPSSACLRAD
jgi:hypothetical protein